MSIQRGGVFTQGRHNYNYYGRVNNFPKSYRMNGQTGFMALDGNGNIAVAEAGNQRYSVLIINLEEGKVQRNIETTTAVTGIAFDRDKIYIGRKGEVEFRRYDVYEEEKVNSLRCPDGSLSSIACKEGYVYILSGEQIYVYEEPDQMFGEYLDKYEPIHIIGSKGSDPGQFTDAKSIAFDIKGNIVVADTGNNRIQVIKKKIIPKSESKIIHLLPTDVRIIGSYGKDPGKFNQPIDFTFINSSKIIVADTGNNRVQILDYISGDSISTFNIFQPKGIVYYANKIKDIILVSTTNKIEVLDPLEFISTLPP